MAKHDARQRLYLDIPYRLTLMLERSCAPALVRTDVVDGAGREFCDAIADLFVGQAKVVAIQFVEPDRVVANGSVAAQADIGENALDGLLTPASVSACVAASIPRLSQRAISVLRTV